MWISSDDDEGKVVCILEGGRVIFDQLWPGTRSAVTHLYISGAATGDGSLCGVTLKPSWRASYGAGDPVCKQCQKISKTYCNGCREQILFKHHAVEKDGNSFHEGCLKSSKVLGDIQKVSTGFTFHGERRGDPGYIAVIKFNGREIWKETSYWNTYINERVAEQEAENHFVSRMETLMAGEFASEDHTHYIS